MHSPSPATTDRSTRRSSVSRMRRLAERLLLGGIMTVIAVVLDRRLQRVFKRQAIGLPARTPASLEAPAPAD